MMHGCQLLDRSLMIGWSKNSWNPERVSSVFTLISVCLSICTWGTEPIFWPRNIIFGFIDPWEMRFFKYFFFPNFHLYAFYLHFFFIIQSGFFTCKNWSSIKSLQIKISRSSLWHSVVWSLRFFFIKSNW